SASAAREIRSLVDESVSRSRAGLEGVAQAADRIRAIMEASHGVAATVGEIAGASREQSAGIQQLNDAIAQLESVTQSNASLAERTARDARDMSDRAATLVAALERFTFDEAQIESEGVIERARHLSVAPPPPTLPSPNATLREP